MRSIVFALVASLGAFALTPRSASAAETFTYRLLPGKNTLVYTLFSDEGNRQLLSGVSGSFEFVLHDDNTIATTAFDLTIEGPILDDVLAPVDDAPFAAGDKLADYLTVDFSATSGFTFGAPTLSGAPPQQQAWVGPEAVREEGGISLGFSYYHLGPLELARNVFTLEGQARPELGGSFRIITADVSGPPPIGPIDHELFGPIYVQPSIALLGPNVERVPEPAAATSMIAGMACLLLRRRR
jgi:hypothetical protein